MLATIISLLMALGLFGSPVGWNNLSSQEQIEMTEIVIDDVYPG